MWNAKEFVSLTIIDIVFQLKNNWNRAKECQYLLRSRFRGWPAWDFIEIGSKLGKERRISEIGRFWKFSAASSGGIKKLFSFLSAVESLGIEGAIKILVIYIYK